jgi:outer membrane receptor protein involved in Fe transport
MLERPFLRQQTISMKITYIPTLVITLLFCSVVTAFAQFPGTIATTPANQAPKGSAKISGALIDSSTNKIVEYASIALYKISSPQPIDGTVSDEKGKFSFSKIEAGEFKLLISFLGYQSKTIAKLTLSKGQELELGAIKLNPIAKNLDEVTVTGKVDLIEEKVDRLVYNAEKDITAKGGDATDVLRKVPMLSVDLDGNVSLRGSQNIKVLINNKPSTIMSNSVADAMKQIPADQIKSVEVITSPSAKYDAEGSAGIINIITKKNSLQGVNLNVDGGVGNRGSILSLNGNYRKGKVGFTLGGFGRASYNVVTRTSLEQSSTVKNINILTRQTGDGYSQGVFGQYNLGFDYDLAKNQTITGGARYGVRGMNFQQKFLTELLNNGQITNSSSRNVDSRNPSGTFDVNLDYVHTFKPQREWSISTLYSRNDLSNNFNADLLNSSGAIFGRQRNINANLNQEFTIQTDYQTPIKRNQMLEFGAKGIFRQVDSDYRLTIAGPSGEFTSSAGQPAGALTYNQNIAAGYSSYTYTTKKRYTFKGGLRYEQTMIDARTQEKGVIGIGNYGVLVPSFNASKTFKGTTIKLAYNRRIQRPGLQQLNPNFNSANPQNITVGNPELKPELTNNFEVTLSRTIKKTFVTAAFFARATNNGILLITKPSDTLAGAVINTYANIGKQQAYGTNIFSNVALTSKINLGIFFNLLYSNLNGQITSVNGTLENGSNSGFNISGGMFGQAQFKKGWGAQLFGFLQGTQVQLQGRQGGFGFYTFGVKKEFKDKKASLGLAAENFLSNRFRIHTELNSPVFSQINNVYLYNRGFRLTFSYKIGKISATEIPRKKGRSVNNDDVKTDGNGQAPASGAPGNGPTRQ